MSGPATAAKPAPLIDPSLGKLELEQNIRTTTKWAEALKRATIQVSDVVAIGTLLDFVEKSRDASIEQYEAAVAQHPEWGRPSDLPRPS